MRNSCDGCPSKPSRTSRGQGCFAPCSRNATAATSSIPRPSIRRSSRSAPSADRAPGSSGSSGCITGSWQSFRRKRRRMSGAKTPASRSRPRWRRSARSLVDGGFRLKGRWSFSSGCDFCQWAVLGALVPPAAADQPPEARMFLVPRRDYAIADNWYVMGLCGTGSKDIVVDDAFVPQYRTYSYQDAFHLRHPGAAVNDAPLYRLPFGLIFANGIAAPAIGVALGALAAFREQAKGRVNLRDLSRVVEDPFVQYRMAEAAAEVGAAHDRLLRNFAEMMRLVRAGEAIPLGARARYRWDAGKAIGWSVRTVDRLFEA